MPVLTKDEYYFMYDRLNSPKDVELMHNRMGYPYNMLFNILAKKVTRDTLKRFYIIKGKSKHLVKLWEGQNKSFLQIAKLYKFSPVLIAGFILQELGYSKKEIKLKLQNTDLIKDKRIKKEILKAIENDFVYSPASSESQAKNGSNTENLIGVWLKSKKVGFETEQESIAKGRPKTPDFLLKKQFNFNGNKLNWIESKASFGDVPEIRKNYKKQLGPYLDLYGPGAVIYWYGYVKEHGFEDFLVLTKEDLY